LGGRGENEIGKKEKTKGPKSGWSEKKEHTFAIRGKTKKKLQKNNYNNNKPQSIRGGWSKENTHGWGLVGNPTRKNGGNAQPKKMTSEDKSQMAAIMKRDLNKKKSKKKKRGNKTEYSLKGLIETLKNVRQKKTCKKKKKGIATAKAVLFGVEHDPRSNKTVHLKRKLVPPTV